MGTINFYGTIRIKRRQTSKEKCKPKWTRSQWMDPKLNNLAMEEHNHTYDNEVVFVHNFTDFLTSATRATWTPSCSRCLPCQHLVLICRHCVRIGIQVSRLMRNHFIGKLTKRHSIHVRQKKRKVLYESHSPTRQVCLKILRDCQVLNTQKIELLLYH